MSIWIYITNAIAVAILVFITYEACKKRDWGENP